ncbi:MAG: ferritin family protein [Dehalococcoidia bacterium]
MDTLQALMTALEREREGEKQYRAAAAGSHSQKAKKMFEWLAQEESGHVRLMELSLEEFKNNSRWLPQDAWESEGFLTEPIQSEELPPKPSVTGELSPDAPELEIIKKAIEAEKADADFYKEMAKNVDDPSGEIALEKLAQVEQGHVALLEEEYQWIRHSKDLFTLHKFLPAG